MSSTKSILHYIILLTGLYLFYFPQQKEGGGFSNRLIGGVK